MAIYNSAYSGAEVDASVAKSQAITKTPQEINELNKVTANPVLAGTEPDLTGLQIENTKYKVPTGTNVVANPTLAGTEADLTGLQVGDTKYKVPSGGGGGGGNIYVNEITIYYNTSPYSLWFYFTIISNTPITSEADIIDYIKTYGVLNYTSANRKAIPCTGCFTNSGNRFTMSCLIVDSTNNRLGFEARQEGTSSQTYYSFNYLEITPTIRIQSTQL